PPGGGEADAHARERARPGADRDAIAAVERDSGAFERAADRGQELLGGAAIARKRLLDGRLARADDDRGAGACGVQGEHDHRRRRATRVRAPSGYASKTLSVSGPRVTPMLRQYFEMKSRVPDAILFYRLGDFYEMFFDDAKEAAPLLGIALTRRHRDSDI